MYRVDSKKVPILKSAWICGAEILWNDPHFSFYSSMEVLRIKNNNRNELLINDGIKYPASKIVRVTGPAGEQIGQMSLSSAQSMAYEKGLDLCLIAAQAEPPVVRIMDYGKYRFEREKKEKEARKKQQIVETKEIQLSVQIDIGDFNTKVNHAIRFLTAGNKVKVIVKFRGRQMAHQDIGRELLNRFSQACAELGTVEKPPIMEGRNLTLFIVPIKATTKSKPRKSDDDSAQDTSSEQEAD